MKPEYLLPYLLHNVELQIGVGRIEEVTGLRHQYRWIVSSEVGSHGTHLDVESVRLLLYPISSITDEMKKEIGLVHDISGNHILNFRTGERINIFSLPYSIVEEFHKRHIDTRDLIGQGLAIDKRTVKCD